MKAEYNKWYNCQKNNMPEDFDNTDNQKLLITYREANTDTLLLATRRPLDEKFPRLCVWRQVYGSLISNYNVISWMLPSPYVE